MSKCNICLKKERNIKETGWFVVSAKYKPTPIPDLPKTRQNNDPYYFRIENYIFKFGFINLFNKFRECNYEHGDEKNVNPKSSYGRAIEYVKKEYKYEF